MIFSSLRRALSGSFLLVSILPIGLFGLVASVYLDSYLNRLAEQRILQLAAGAGELTELHLERVLARLRITIALFEDEQLIAPAQRERLLALTVRDTQLFDVLLLTDRARRVQSIGLSPTLAEHAEDYLGLDLSGHAVFLGPPGRGGALWSDVFLSLVSGEPHIAVALPCAEGWLFGEIALTSLSEGVARLAQSTEVPVTLMVVDQRGTVIVADRFELVREQASVSHHPEIVKGLEGRLQQQVSRSDHGGRAWLEGVVSLPGLGWVAYAGQDRAALLAPLRRMQTGLLLTMGLGIAGAVLFGVFKARRLMRPLHQLLGRVEAVALGDYGFLPVNSRYREIEILAASFQAMAEGVAQRESDLQESEGNFRRLSREFAAVLEGIPDRIMLLDRELRLLWSNHQDDTLAAQAAPGLCCHQLLYGRSESCPGCPVPTCPAGDTPGEGDVTHDDGRSFSVRAVPVPASAEGESEARILVVSQDVTEKVRLREQATRTSQLAALGELAAGVAHEINNPVNGIINYAQLLLNRFGGDPRAAEPAGRIIAEGERIATIVRELLFFAREETEERRLCEPRAIIEELLLLTVAQLRKERIQLDLVLADDLPRIACVPQQLLQVGLNLISNARYALNQRYPQEDPGKRLALVGRRVERGGQVRLRLVFEDAGTGIPAHLLERVLNPFVTTKPAGVGTGLGLSISHEIVKKHGGTLTIASREGEFTRVTVELPAAPAAGGEGGACSPAS